MYSPTALNRIVELVTIKVDEELKLGMKVDLYTLNRMGAVLQNFADKTCVNHDVEGLMLLVQLKQHGKDKTIVSVDFYWVVL